LGSAGFLRVTVASGSVTVDYIKTYLPSEESADHKNGEVAYSYTYRNNDVQARFYHLEAYSCIILYNFANWALLGSNFSFKTPLGHNH
jgi:hypothetical protein